MSARENLTSLAHTFRRARTLYERRRLGYALYFVAQHSRLRWLYRYAWGPRSWRVVRTIFALGAPLASQRTPPALLRRVIPDKASLAATDAASAAVLMNGAHSAGITGVATLFTTRPDASAGLRFHRSRGAYYLAARDVDRQMFNRHFGTSLLTEEAARRQLELLRDRVCNEYRDYAPIDFGGGLSFGRIASTESGTGRWEFFNGSIVTPLIVGKRVLDLGCNNGSLTLMMLRAGASEVTAVELTPEIADVARLNVRILSWRDGREYRCQVLTGDMRMWLTHDLGPFDVVTAFCSLYYLPEADMGRIIRKAADTGATLVLQSNDEIDDLPAQADVLRRLLHANGYSHVAVSAFPGFARQLLVASVNRSARDPATSGERGILSVPSPTEFLAVRRNHS